MPSTTSDSAGPRADEPPAKPSHLDSIRVGLPSDRAIAEILGVSPSQVSRWRRGQAPDMENADRLAGLALVVEMLSRWLSTEVIEEWLTGPNAHLGDRTPAYHVRRGQLAEVVGAVEAMKAGTFA
jgi:transcriptional regulator with XRE-family HTH domain